MFIVVKRAWLAGLNAFALINVHPILLGVSSISHRRGLMELEGVIFLYRVLNGSGEPHKWTPLTPKPERRDRPLPLTNPAFLLAILFRMITYCRVSIWKSNLIDKRELKSYNSMTERFQSIWNHEQIRICRWSPSISRNLSALQILFTKKKQINLVFT